jgi:S1-C subfamily serine protease
MKKILGIFAVASIGGVTSLGISHFINNNSSAQPGQVISQTPVKYVNMSNYAGTSAVDFTAAAASSVNSVVNVKTTYPMQSQNLYMYDPFRDFFGLDRQPQIAEAPVSTGSGVIISQDGYIVTNNHVIDGADKIEITLNDKRSYVA